VLGRGFHVVEIVTPEAVMQTRKLFVAMVVLAVLVATGVFVSWPQTDPASRITWQNFERIAFGVTRAEVDNILGRPGDFTTGPTRGGRGGGITSGRPRRGPCLSWEANHATYSIGFDAEGQVCEKIWQDFEPVHLEPFPNFFWHVNRQWRRWFP
jgi:hypothetical protein